MSNKTIRVGIIGYGIVGKRRRLHIDNHDNMTVVSICDVRFKKDESMVNNNTSLSDYKNIEIASKENPFSSRMLDGISFYNNYDLMLNDRSLDAVFICVPNYLASELTVRSIKLGLHVFCEKPPGRTVRDIENVIDEKKRTLN